MSATLDGGDWAAITSAIILISGLLWRWYQILKLPFRIQAVTNFGDFVRGERYNLSFSNKVNIYMDDDVKLIRIIPRKATSFGRINIRFFNRKLSVRFNRIWEYYNADTKIIRVTELEDVDYKETGEAWGRSYFESEEDGVGGFFGIYSPALYVRQDDLVWYYVYTQATDIWNGYISFDGTLGERRMRQRMKARVIMPNILDEKGKAKRLTKKQFHKLLAKASQPIKKSEKEKS
ncbi:hypothetical protein ACFLV4_04180 [Chloroflexota bacterium]